MSALSEVFRKAIASFKKDGGRILNVSRVEEDTNAPATDLKQFPKDYRVTVLTTEHQVNAALRTIFVGVVGFDTEFTDRTPTKEEQTIMDYYPHAPGVRKQAMTGMQIAQLHCNATFDVAWDNVGIRLVQIAWEDEAWVIDLRAIKAVPKQLARILQSPAISKAGVGLTKDISVVWDDLRMEMKNLVDVGMMAKLVMAERYPKVGYGNMSLKQSVADVLGFRIEKDMQTSNWAAEDLSDEQIEYAALDAVACLRLHKALVDELVKKSVEVDSPIPKAWYTFNTKAGEPMRTKRGEDGTEIPWKTSDCSWFSGGRFVGYP
ncbi:ribonuclease H-like domain-containing protein [Mycena alexandri]|uniref:3'-5' exonuclease n=1 Tax=Mycena alexandri TaxID=1745969 RepID=A0AAD6S360_9AGAR|nr:ribonuclease H-like domain-containing protein [Mycena alexandri]